MDGPWSAWAYNLGQGRIFGEEKERIILEILELGGMRAVELRCGIRFTGEGDKPSRELAIGELLSIKQEILRDRSKPIALFPNDWIENGGNLFFRPFLSQALLFRLFDEDCSILLRHNRISSELGPRHLPDGTPLWETKPRDPIAIFIHFSSSAVLSLSRLHKIPCFQMDLPASTGRRWDFANIVVEVEPWLVAGDGMFLCYRGDQQGQQYVFPIVDSDFVVKGPVTLQKLGGELPLAVADGQFKCWKVSITNSRFGNAYDLFCTRRWSLDALEITESGDKISELALVRKGDHSGSD